VARSPHTFARRLVMAGVDLPTVASLMGHLNIQMTMRYAHLAPAHKAAAVEKLRSMRWRGSARNLLYCFPLARRNRLALLQTPKQKVLRWWLWGISSKCFISQ
jgi:hypothetical protein